jgi:hypothetical protein
MTEQHETGGVSENGSTPKAHLALFATLAECQQVAPPSGKFRAFCVTLPGGREAFTWACDVAQALVTAARHDGYTARVAEPKGSGPLTRERLAGGLAALSPEDRALLIQQYVPAPKKSKVKE